MEQYQAGPLLHVENVLSDNNENNSTLLTNTELGLRQTILNIDDSRIITNVQNVYANPAEFWEVSTIANNSIADRERNKTSESFFKGPPCLFRSPVNDGDCHPVKDQSADHTIENLEQFMDESFGDLLMAVLLKELVGLVSYSKKSRRRCVRQIDIVLLTGW